MVADRAVVVVVDDDPGIARLLEEVLQVQFDVHAVTSPREALNLVDGNDVAVLLADLHMPEMGGVELLTEARHRRPNLVGVLITAHADVESAIRAINAAHVLGFLTKPWDEDELFSVMNRAVDAHRALRQLLRASAATERPSQPGDEQHRAEPSC